jgi:hypothetical protein
MPELVPGLDSGLLTMAVVMVLAVVVAVLTKSRLGYEPEHATSRRAEMVGIRTQPRVQ